MMKALLVIYVVSVGQAAKERGGSLTTTPFETMEQCKAAITFARQATDSWHYGDDKTDIVPMLRTLKCHHLPQTEVTVPQVQDHLVRPQPIPPITVKKHNKWTWQ